MRRGVRCPTIEGIPPDERGKARYHNATCRGEKKVKTAAGRENFHTSSVVTLVSPGKHKPITLYGRKTRGERVVFGVAVKIRYDQKKPWVFFRSSSLLDWADNTRLF